ncbi:carbohydrate sulfotransferase 10-like isoform X1 [Styela clava]
MKQFSMLRKREGSTLIVGVCIFVLGYLYYAGVLLSTNIVRDMIVRSNQLDVRNKEQDLSLRATEQHQDSNIQRHLSKKSETSPSIISTTFSSTNAPTTPNRYIECKEDLEALKQEYANNSYKMKEEIEEQFEMFIGSMSATQIERQKIVINGCEGVKKPISLNAQPNYESFLNISLGRHPTIYYSSKYNVMFCEVAKVGCTQFKLALLEMENIVRDPYKLEHEDIHAAAYDSRTMLEHVNNLTKIKEVIDTYFKIMIVREPFQRLLSAYNDKLAPKKDFYHPKYTPISEYIREKFHRSNTTQKMATFENFIDFLLDQNQKGKTLDLHWDLYTRACDPCVYKYDYIARLETIEKDARYLEEKLGLNKELRQYKPITLFHGASDNSIKAQTSYEKTKIAYNMIPKYKRLKLFEMYKPDYDIFGYPYPANLLQ